MKHLKKLIERRWTNMIDFSEKAYQDGFDFSNFTLEEQEMTKEYYSSKEEIYEAVKLVKAARYYMRNHFFDCTVKPLIDFDWRFFKSGNYEAVIVNCTKSAKKGSEDYIIELMLDEYTIKYIKFNPYYSSSPVTDSILEELDYRNNYYDVVGRYVYFEINNTIYNNRVFSKVTEFKFVDENIIDLHFKMYDVIRETCLKNIIKSNSTK